MDLDDNQTAAQAVAEKYSAALVNVRSKPIYSEQKIIDLLRPLAFDDMIQANLNFMADWRDKGWRDRGPIVTVTTDVSPAGTLATGWVQVTVSMCKDQRGVTVVDEKGRRVTDEAARFPAFLQSTYDVRKKKGSDTFKVYEIGGSEVQACE